MTAEDIIGQKFGKLTILSMSKVVKYKTGTRHYVICLCECGNTKEVIYENVKYRITTSCGCWGKEVSRKMLLKHGMWNKKEWKAWIAAKNRCVRYGAYVAKGIKMCHEWDSSFEEFYAYMGPIPEGKPSLDRIDNSKGYEPGNCRWVSWREQGRNRSNNVVISHNGESHVAVEWAEITGIKACTIFRRVKMGLPVELILYKGSLKKDKILINHDKAK